MKDEVVEDDILSYGEKELEGAEGGVKALNGAEEDKVDREEKEEQIIKFYYCRNHWISSVR